jgi:hypothetical protein
LNQRTNRGRSRSAGGRRRTRSPTRTLSDIKVGSWYHRQPNRRNKEMLMEVFEDGSLRLTKVGPLGPYANNAYVIADRDAAEAVIVDMPAESSQTLEAVGDLKVVAILLTHTHPDHWPDYDLVKEATDAPVFCHPAEVMLPAAKIDRPLTDGDHLTVGGLRLQVIHTPGHTPGSCCFLVGRHLIAGDTLFPGGPGHSNSAQELQQNIASTPSGCTPCPTRLSSSPATATTRPSSGPARSTPSSPPAHTHRTSTATCCGSPPSGQPAIPPAARPPR